MSYFHTPLVIRDVDGSDFDVWCDLWYQSDLLGGKLIKVSGMPNPFRTDLASIPKNLIIPKLGLWNPAAVIHDKLFATQIFAFDFCNAVLKEAMLARNVPAFRAEEIYEGVHLFGSKAWKDDQAKYGLSADWRMNAQNPLLNNFIFDKMPAEQLAA